MTTPALTDAALVNETRQLAADLAESGWCKAGENTADKAADRIASLSVQVEALSKALEKAVQLAAIASDWNLDEVEIDGKMVRTFELVKEFRAALSAPGALMGASSLATPSTQGDGCLIAPSEEAPARG